MRLPLLLIATTLALLTHAQDVHTLHQRIDSLALLPAAKAYTALEDIMGVLREEVSAEEGRREVQRIETIVGEKESPTLVARFILHKSIWTNIAVANKAEALAILLQGLRYAEEQNCPNEKADILRELGIQYHDAGYPEKALEYFLKTADFLHEHDYKLDRTASHLVTIGDFYYRMGLYDRAAEFFTRFEEKGETMPVGWHEGNRLNTAGLTFRKLKQYDKALHYFNRSLEIMRDMPEWRGLLRGNMGSVYYEMGQPDNAIPLLEEDVTISLETKLYTSAARALELLARIAFEQNDLDKAVRYYARALDVNALAPEVSLERDANQGLADLYTRLGDTRKALECFKRYTLLKDSVAAQDKAEEMRKLEMRHTYERQEQERQQQIAALAKEKELLQNKQRATIIVGVLVLVVTVLAFFANRQRLRRKRELLQMELDFNKRELELHIQKLVEKTSAVEELQKQLDRLPVATESVNDEKTVLIDTLMQSSILTEKDWTDFKHIFEQVHRGFFTRLRTTWPDLTEGEIRLAALVKLNLSSKEIGSMLGISTDSVNKSRYRLRKKLKMEGEMSLEEFVGRV